MVLYFEWWEVLECMFWMCQFDCYQFVVVCVFYIVLELEGPWLLVFFEVFCSFVRM